MIPHAFVERHYFRGGVGEKRIVDREHRGSVLESPRSNPESDGSFDPLKATDEGPEQHICVSTAEMSCLVEARPNDGSGAQPVRSRELEPAPERPDITLGAIQAALRLPKPRLNIPSSRAPRGIPAVPLGDGTRAVQNGWTGVCAEGAAYRLMTAI